jgi:predicted alpha/beta-hydrolase family hydrolase
MKTSRLKFVAHPTQGNVSAILQVPRQADALMVLGHGAGAGMGHANMEAIADSLHNQRIATFRYQFPFMERGGGRDSLEVSLSTVRNACRRAAQLESGRMLFAGGHSFGGRMTTLAAAESALTSVTGLVLFAFPLHPPGKPSIDRAQHLSQISIPLLFLSGTRDKLFTIDRFKPVLASLSRKAKPVGSPKVVSPKKRPSAKLHLLDTADHGYKTLKKSRQPAENVFDEMARVTRDWIG